MVTSIGKIASPSQAVSYFEKDGYYARDDPAHREASACGGNDATLTLQAVTTIELSSGGRALLKGRTGGELNTAETEGQMLQRVMPDLMDIKNILVLNDEAHHCYREKPPDPDDAHLKGDDKKEAEKNNEAARLWISGLEAVNRKLGRSRVIDLSATPFFLRGSGYAEGTLFPWTMSDFSLMDAIECGIVKLPCVPVAQNIPGDEMPVYRNLWENIRKEMPRRGRGQGGELYPLKLPTRLQTALEALYGHYEKTFRGCVATLGGGLLVVWTNGEEGSLPTRPQVRTPSTTQRRGFVRWLPAGR